ncbi:hypothetical protein CN923_13615 [Bacillus cereus]|nr:hypothetical protein CON44_28940 [Bacillus cereus]PED63153.1 hypothetical protein CON89_02065 [Bacillus toyonensis]PEN38120.1 hypothetical protein CN541_15610 [Bacillus toyonensis]PFK23228.1 hypothetical protein COJ05_15245 [Bacillus cereus]PFP55404.1 hypothetical protein COK09_21115 [Bacillus cereus]
MLMYSIAVGILMFVTIVIMPEFNIIHSLPIDISKWLYYLVLGIFFLVVKEKWWIKMVSIILGIGVFMIFGALFVS